MCALRLHESSNVDNAHKPFVDIAHMGAEFACNFKSVSSVTTRTGHCSCVQ